MSAMWRHVERPDPGMKTCCTPSRAEAGKAPLVMKARNERRSPGDVSETVDIPGGTALVGTASPYFATDGEGPLRRKKLAPFRIGATTVTNAEFQAFTDATGYETEAERFGNSLVFQGLLPPGSPATQAVADAPWWRLMPGADWRKPIGPDGHDALADHPVVHISWNDANAFCAWAGARWIGPYSSSYRSGPLASYREKAQFFHPGIVTLG